MLCFPIGLQHRSPEKGRSPRPSLLAQMDNQKLYTRLLGILEREGRYLEGQVPLASIRATDPRCVRIAAGRGSWPACLSPKGVPEGRRAIFYVIRRYNRFPTSAPWASATHPNQGGGPQGAYLSDWKNWNGKIYARCQHDYRRHPGWCWRWGS